MWFLQSELFEPGTLKLEAGETMNALEFLAQFKALDGNVDIGKNVVVIGGGNTAMDTARAAKRTNGVEKVSLVYRRTKRYMPADAEELEMAVEDGVEFCELLAPVRLEAGKLVCKVMKLGDLDASGRRGVVETGEFAEVDADTVIVAVGEKVPTAFYKATDCMYPSAERHLSMKKHWNPTWQGSMLSVTDWEVRLRLSRESATVRWRRKRIIGECLAKDFDQTADEETIYNRRGILRQEADGKDESTRCLGCSTICENCTEVCPNRANVAIRVPGMEKHQIIHVDYMCNECGNCEVFCPYKGGRPYKDKFTLYWSEEDFLDSTNEGFLPLEGTQVKVRLDGKVETVDVAGETDLSADAVAVIRTVLKDYAYLIH